jgi:DNA-binding SARP family transcriptional activator
MSRLPPHHVPRPRLTERCAGEGVIVVVVEAAAGYGKTVLSAELVEAWGAVPIEVLLEPGDVSASLLAARLHAAVARAGFADAAGLMAQAGADPVSAVDAMVDALEGESCAIVIDDAHNAARDAGALIDRIASRVRPPQRLAVLTRRLPEGAERLRRAEAVQLTAADLALSAEETLELCRTGFGLEVSSEDGRLLDALSGGWTAAAVLAAPNGHRQRLVRAPGPGPRPPRLDNPRRYTSVLLFRAKVLGELGRYEEADADFDEILRIARTLPDPANKVAYVHWERAIQASMRGDAEATLAHVQQAEANRADWWKHGRFDFFADAADSLARVGHTALAWEYLERAQADPGDAERLIAMAECALLARHGDPARAEEQLLAVYDHGIVPREFWRVTLLRAYAALRRGDPVAGALAARAFEEAARLGAPQLPLIRERELTEALLALAVETGSPAARALEGSSLPVALALLGRFELTEGGRALPLGSGQAAQLVKLVAVSGGRIHAEQAIEALWPDSDPAAGRNRLRTVLGRLREAAQDAVHREGELLCLAANVRVDLAQFQQESRQALALSYGDPSAAVAVARSAIARYRGDLLPHDLYEDWSDAPREEARRTMLELLDLCAAAAAERGDLDEARRMVERTIELAPYDDDRYLKVASILHEQGRRGAALSVLRRARSTLAELGVPLPAELQDFEAALVA